MAKYYEVAGLKITGGSPAAGKILASDASGNTSWVDNAGSAFTKIERYGFVDNTQTTMSFNDSTHLFTLAKTGSTFEYLWDGAVVSKSANMTLDLSTSGTNYTAYVSINASGELQSGGVWDLSTAIVPVAIIRVNTSLTPKYILQDERHTCLMDRRTHEYLHTTVGTKVVSNYTPSGCTAATATDAGITWGIGGAVLADEDLKLQLAELVDDNGATAKYFIFYRTNATTWAWKTSLVPLSYTTTGFGEYDLNGSLTPSQNARFVNYYLIMTNAVGQYARYALIPGQTEYTSASLAYQEAFTSLTLTNFPLTEWVAVYQLTYEFKTASSSKGKAELTRLPYRITTSAVTAASAGSATHNSLAGLQGGTSSEYYHLTSAQNTALGGLLTTASTDKVLISTSAGTISWTNQTDALNLAKWKKVAGYTAACASATTITVTAGTWTSYIGYPIRMTFNDTSIGYGVVTNFSSTTLTVSGYNLNGKTLATTGGLEVGDPMLLCQLDLFAPGEYAKGSTSISNVLNNAANSGGSGATCYWRLPSSKLVALWYRENTLDSSNAEPQLVYKHGSSATHSAYTVTDSWAMITGSGLSNQQVTPGTEIVISSSTSGSSETAKDLSVVAIYLVGCADVSGV